MLSSKDEGTGVQTEVKKRLFTADEYHRMGETGIFHPEERTELIDGEIVLMTPIGYRHALCVSRVNTLLIQALGNRMVLGPQNPLRLSDWTEPQPDIVVYKPRSDFYAKKRQRPSDVLLLIEVADTSLRHDQKTKLARYAKAGIPEVWIEDLQHNLLYVYRIPSARSYSTVLTLSPENTVSPAAFPDISFSVDELLGTDCEF